MEIKIPEVLLGDYAEALEFMQTTALDNIAARVEHTDVTTPEGKATVAKLAKAANEVSNLTLEQWILEQAQPVVAEILKNKRAKQLKAAFSGEGSTKEKGLETADKQKAGSEG